MASSDALRASLDKHEVDRKAGRDREYVESLLRRLGEPPEKQMATAKAQVKPEPKPEAKPAKEKAKATGKAEKKEPKPKAEPEIITFTRVKPKNHPRGNTAVFKAVQKDKKRIQQEKRARRNREADAAAEWEDVTEGEDPRRRPDSKKGYMKGKFALLKRQMDRDHAVYFFATEIPDDAEQARIPQGYVVRLTEETRLPYIAKRGKTDVLRNTAHVRAESVEDALDIAAAKGIGGIGE